MIDRQARDSAANALRDFMKGSISNRECERRYPRSKGDPAVWSIYSYIWFFYSDSSEHVLSGKHSLTQEGLAFMERCLLFLQSDLDFQWPNTKVHIWYPVLRLIGLGGIVNRRIEKQMSVGDKEVWPFLRKADYDMMRVKGES
jgi:hypothetical protein